MERTHLSTEQIMGMLREAGLPPADAIKGQ
jgi:hypothetical protein